MSGATSWDPILDAMPAEGRLLDVGCGGGHLADNPGTQDIRGGR